MSAFGGGVKCIMGNLSALGDIMICVGRYHQCIKGVPQQ